MATKPGGKKPAPEQAPIQPTKPARPPKGSAGSVAPDWERIELDYRAGIKTLRQIAEENGISHVAVNKRAKKDGWERDLKERAGMKQPVVLSAADPMARAGFVYVIYLQDSAGERFYKIGFSAAFSARFGAHQCASPFPVCVAAAYFVGDMRTEERQLHRKFADQHVRGEWFRLSPCDLKKIAERALIV